MPSFPPRGSFAIRAADYFTPQTCYNIA